MSFPTQTIGFNQPAGLSWLVIYAKLTRVEDITENHYDRAQVTACHCLVFLFYPVQWAHGRQQTSQTALKSEGNIEDRTPHILTFLRNSGKVFFCPRERQSSHWGGSKESDGFLLNRTKLSIQRYYKWKYNDVPDFQRRWKRRSLFWLSIPVQTQSTNCDLKQKGGVVGGSDAKKGGDTGWAGSLDTLLALQFNHCILREVLTVVLWKLLKLLSKVKWNCSLSGQHWENKGICSWLLINVERDQHKGFIKLYIT